MSETEYTVKEIENGWTIRYWSENEKDNSSEWHEIYFESMKKLCEWLNETEE